MKYSLKKTPLGIWISNKKRAIIATVDPEKATKRLYYNIFGRKLNLSDPKTINEKIQFLKLKTYYNNPKITDCIDKLKVKEYLSETAYGDLVVPLIAFYDHPREIEWDKLPPKFVIKCNHGCGYNLIVSNKETIDKNETIVTIKKWMKEDYWKKYAEVQYRFIKKQILIEELLDGQVFAYKFYCFNGIPNILYISSDGENGEKDLYIDYYDMNLNKLDITLGTHEHYPDTIQKPKCWDKLVSTATNLSKDFPFVRIDLYVVNEKIYFSEYTFIPTGGFMQLKPASVDNEWGSWLSL